MAKQRPSVAEFIAIGKSSGGAGTLIEFAEFYAGTGLGGGIWRKTDTLEVSGSPQIPSERGAREFRDSTGAVWELVPNGDIYASSVGVVGNGVFDDTSAYIASMNPVYNGNINTSNLSQVRVTSQITFPDGVSLKTGKTPFNVDYNETGLSPALVTAGDITADTIRAALGSGIVFVRVIRVTGGNYETNIGSIFCESVDQQANRTSKLDAAVTVNSSGARVHYIYTENFDNGIAITDSEDISVISTFTKSYVRGMLNKGLTGFDLKKSKAKTRSLNATTDPGHNSILIEGCIDSQWGDLNLRDAGEHAFRIGGDVGELSENLQVTSIMALYPGQCAVKINPDQGTRCRNITIGQVNGLDCATGNSTGENEDILRIESALDVTIGTVSGNRKNKANCGNDFIYLNYVDRVAIGVAVCDNPLRSAVYIDDSRGECRDVTISSLKVNSTAGKVLTINSPTEPCRNINIQSGYVRNAIPDQPIVDLTLNSPTGGAPAPIIISLDVAVTNWSSPSSVVAADLITSNSTAGRIYNNMTPYT